MSMVLHFIVGTLSILTLAGITFNYTIPNMSTEVILLVDVTYSGETVEEQKNEFIMNAISESRDVAQIGIVTFGYGEPVYAVPLTTDTSNVYFDYISAEKPDDSATDLESALHYTKELFKNKGTAKIIIISDGLETDGKASVSVKELAAEGIEVNCVYFEGEKPSQEIQLEAITTPDYNVTPGDKFKVSTTVRSSYEGDVKVELYDNRSLVAEKVVNICNGVQDVEMEHVFSLPGLHSLSFKVSGGSDSCKSNNIYESYIYVESFTKILMVERNEMESKAFSELLEQENEEFEITTLNIFNKDQVPKSVDALRQFDQVVLYNIANADMPEGFIDLLYTYVNDFGGGLLTVGGNKIDENGNTVLDRGEPIPNAYNREDMYETLYQEMLPVQAIDYTPPVAVMIIVDRSGSMEMAAGQSGQTKLELAKQGAKACLDALTERDYCGIVSLEDSYREEMKPLPLPKKAEILAAIDNLGEDQAGGGTVYQGAIEQAGAALEKLDVERKHILLVSDAA
ncbi:MAG: VWA domain-containing protein, partial [Clostridia bacterium]|nr:VWA domain-containing protein [Clostridia bacterium]